MHLFFYWFLIIFLSFEITADKHNFTFSGFALNLNNLSKRHYQYLEQCKFLLMTGKYVWSAVAFNVLWENCAELNNQYRSQIAIINLHTPVKVTALNLKFRSELHKVNGTTTIRGYFGELFTIFSTDFNISIQITHSKDNQFGALKGNWTGMMSDLVYGIADISAGIVVTRQRRDFVKTSPQLYSLQFDVLYRKAHTYQHDYFFFLKPFKMDVWFSIFSITLIFILINAFSKCGIKSLTLTGFINDSVNQFLLCWPIVISGKFSLFYSVKLCLEVYIIFSMLMWNCYTSTLTSLFSTNKMEIPFTSLDDMLTNTNYLAVVINGSKVESYLTKLSYIHRLIKVKNINDAIAAVYSRKAAFNYPLIGLTDLISNNCSLSIAPQYTSKDSNSLAYSKKFAYVEYFNNKIVLLKECGILPRIYTSNFADAVIMCSDENSFYSIRLGQIIGPLVLVFAGILVGLFCLVFELILHYFKFF